jgi:hypothetical protein
MSARSNGSGDQLRHSEAIALSTGDWVVGVWIKPIAYGAADVDLFALSANPTDPATHALDVFMSSSGSVEVYDAGSSYTATGGTSAAATLSLATWYYLVMQRNGTALTLRVFADSTSTTPLGTGSGTIDVSDMTDLAEVLAGEVFTGSWYDGEAECLRVVKGTTWTDAQARTESQSYDYVLGTGTIWLNCRLKDVDADTDGLNDSSGAGNNLTNTGWVAGASTPSQLSGSSSTPTATESTTVSEAVAGGFTALVIGAEN